MFFLVQRVVKRQVEFLRKDLGHAQCFHWGALVSKLGQIRYNQGYQV